MSLAVMVMRGSSPNLWGELEALRRFQVSWPRSDRSFAHSVHAFLTTPTVRYRSKPL